MKKLKFLALGLVAAFAFAACGEEDDEVAFCASDAQVKESTVVMGGAKSSNGSFFTFDKGVQTKTQLGDVATNVVFCFQTLDEAFQFISGTEATNEIVKAQASETKFAMIGDATIAKASKLNESDFTATKMEINKKLENGKKAVAFMNAKCKGFFEVMDYASESEDLTLKMYIIQE